MKPFNILKDYEQFLNERREEKMRVRLSIMTLLLESVTDIMRPFGWTRKGNGNVTDTMVRSGIFKFDYVKEYNGEKVITTINININDDYNEGYSQIIVRGSKKIKSTRWWSKGSDVYGTHIEFDPNSTFEDKPTDTFHLTTHLKTIDKSYNE